MLEKFDVQLPARLDPRRLFRRDSTIELPLGLGTPDVIKTRFCPLRDPRAITKCNQLLQRVWEVHEKDELLTALSINPLYADKFDELFKICCPEFSGDYAKALIPDYDGTTVDVGCWLDLNARAKAVFLDRFLETEMAR